MASELGSSQRGVLIVTIDAVSDLEAIRKRIAGIEGVRETDYSYLTKKLQVRYEGSKSRLDQIDLEIKRVLQDGRKQSR